MSGDQEGEAQVGMEVEGGGPPRPGPAMAAAFTGTDPQQNRQQDKEDDGVGPAPGPATGARHRRQQPAPSTAPATAHRSTTCNAAEDPHASPLYKDQNRQQDKEDDGVGPAPAPAPGPTIGANPDVNNPLQGQEEVRDDAPGPAPATAHHSTTCNAAEDPDTNPLFKNAQSRNWKLHSNSDAMVKENQDVMDWIDQLLEKEAGIYCVEEEGQSHYLHQTTDGVGFFKLVLQPDVEALAAGQAIEGVTLVFSLKDLYLLGFLYKNTWYFYSDATLDGSGHNQPGNESYWDYLPFEGGYTKDMFTNVKVGTYELNLSHHALSEYLSRLKKGQQDEIQSALYRIIVVIAEAKRFPQWLQVLQQSFADKLSRVTGATFGQLFQDWSNICKRVLEGPKDFEPDSDFATYGKLVDTISVLLKSAFANDDMSVESIDWQSKEVKFVFDPDYDLEEDEEDTDDDEHEEREGEDEEEEEEEEEEEHEERGRRRGEDSDRIEEDEEDAVAEDEKSGGQGQNCSYWIIFFMCIILVLVWMTVF